MHKIIRADSKKLIMMKITVKMMAKIRVFHINALCSGVIFSCFDDDVTLAESSKLLLDPWPRLSCGFVSAISTTAEGIFVSGQKYFIFDQIAQRVTGKKSIGGRHRARFAGPRTQAVPDYNKKKVNVNKVLFEC